MTDTQPERPEATTPHNCHENIHWHLNLQHFGDTNIKYLEVTGRCLICGTKVAFRGLPGLSPAHPTTAIDGSEAIFPFLFEDEDYDGNAYSVSVSGEHSDD